MYTLKVTTETKNHLKSKYSFLRERLYLQWVLGADGQNLVLEVADLTAPGASLTDPADKAGLVSTAHRASTATRAQQLPLQDTKSSCMGHTAFSTGRWMLKLLLY